ncbi:MAG: hypothetical protein LUH07_03685, partial [Lachnospiraceae bacterium]|nr:hypothetical protein [Lachnospiraceae bacterium]
MNLDNMRQEFPEMPEDMRIMIEREVALQLKTEQSQNNRFARDDEKIVLDSEWESEQERKRDERRNLTQKRSGRKKTGKIFIPAEEKESRS